MFTVVITTHDRPLELLRAVASIASQNIAPDELVVVDDASSPPVDLDAIRSHARGLPTRVLRHETPRGPGAARNAGIKAATQEWIVFLDDDDEFEASKIESLRDELSARPDSDLIYHPALILMPNERVSYVSRPQRLPESRAVAFRALLIKNVIGGTSMVAARREALRTAGGFDESLRAFEDYELWLRMASRGHRMRLLDRVLTRYYHVTRKISVTKSKGADMSGFAAIEAKYHLDYAGLTTDDRRAHEIWCYDTITHRAILKLGYGETLASIVSTLRTFRQPRYLLILAAACLGPRFLIRLRARRARHSAGTGEAVT